MIISAEKRENGRAVRKGVGEKGWRKKIKKGEGIRKERRRSTKRSRKVKNPLEKRGKITKTKDYEKQNTRKTSQQNPIRIKNRGIGPWR